MSQLPMFKHLDPKNRPTAEMIAKKNGLHIDMAKAILAAADKHHEMTKPKAGAK